MNMFDIVLPDYNHCILNTITSILKYYNVNTKHKSLKSLDEKLKAKRYKNVILFILDGLGEHILNEVSKNGFFIKNKIDCVTSVYPSTTTAALTTYYSGLSPYESGFIAWSQYFKEYGRTLDMLSHNDSYEKVPLYKPLIDIFETDMKYESVFEKIEKENKNVKAFEIGPEYSNRRGKRKLIADNIDELIENINDISELNCNKFIMAYCDNPDKTIHKFGTDSIECKDFILDAETKIKKLKEDLGEDTIIIVTADHGHKNIGKSYSITDYKELWECFLLPPTFESRALNFYIKQDMKDVFENKFNQLFKDEFWLINKDDFLNKYHFLGYGNKHSKIDDFVGDFIAMSISDSMIKIENFFREGKPVKKSTHCGLTKEEMEVPVIVLD